jgi:hypothetical protein
MSPLVLRAAEHVHGHLGWLSAAALCHPAILLRQPRRRAIAATVGATILVTAVAVLGAVLYPEYRASVKPALFASAPAAGSLFERKEHLGVATLVLAWVGLAAHLVARHRREPQLARAAFVAFTGAAAFASLSAAMGLAVAVHRTFP